MGFEPTTCGLRNRCSATELRWPEAYSKAKSTLFPRLQDLIVAKLLTFCYQQVRLEYTRFTSSKGTVAPKRRLRK